MKPKFFIFLLLVMVAAGKSQAEQKTYWVDFHQVIAESKEGKKILFSLEEEFKFHRARLEKQEKEILKHQEDFGKKKSVLSDEALQAKREALQEETLKFQQEVQRSQAQLQKQRNENLQPLFARLTKLVQKIASTKGISYVQQRTENLIYASPDLDLTAEVVRALDQG